MTARAQRSGLEALRAVLRRSHPGCDVTFEIRPNQEEDAIHTDTTHDDRNLAAVADGTHRQLAAIHEVAR